MFRNTNQPIDLCHRHLTMSSPYPECQESLLMYLDWPQCMRGEDESSVPGRKSSSQPLPGSGSGYHSCV